MVPEDEIVSQAPLAVTAWSRPKRVAFLLNPETTDDSILNEIIRFSASVWGGRYHAIVPTTGDNIEPDWWRLLVTIDPDVVYALLPLSDNLIDRVNRHILPAKIIEKIPENHERGGRRFHIDRFGVGALENDDIPSHIWATRGGVVDPIFFYIQDAGLDSPEHNFVLRNFGALSATISTNNAFRDVPNEVFDLKSVSHRDILARLISSHGKAVVPLSLCGTYTTRSYFMEYEPFSQGYHFVIGNTARDFIYAWNHSSTWNAGFGGRLFGRRDAFWITEAQAKDDDLLNDVIKLIESNLWNLEKTEQHGKVISYSVEDKELRRIASKVGEMTHFRFDVERLQPSRFPLGNRRAVGKISEQPTALMPLSENNGQILAPRPVFLREGHPQMGWMVDLEIQYHPERYSTWTNARPYWKLPKRDGFAGRFFEPHRESRVVHGGLPSCFVVPLDRSIGIHIPGDSELAWRCLDRRFHNTSSTRRQAEPIFGELRVSDKGQYLRGMVKLFGGISSAGNYFEDPFWKDTFLLMAGRPENDLTRRATRAREVLDGIFAEDATPIDPNSGRLDRLAADLARRLTLRDAETKVLTKQDLKSRFGQLRSEDLRNDRNVDWWRDYETFDEYKEWQLTALLEGQILFQGSECKCSHCGSVEWYPADDLAAQVRCVGCLTRFPLPPTPTWSFRLNELVASALRKHGTLAVLQTLYVSQHSHGLSDMFLYLPCQEIFKRGVKQPFTDLDVVPISNGKLIVGEVKSDSGGFAQIDFERLLEVAREIRPDEVILSAPGEEWPPHVMTEINNLAQSLKSYDVNVTPLLLRRR